MKNIIKSAIVAATLVSFHVQADEMTCTKFTDTQERVMQESLMHANPGKDVEFLKGEFCHNQNDSMLAQQVGGVAGAVISPLGVAGPLLGLLFGLAAHASSPEMVGIIKVVASVDGAVVKRKFEVTTFDEYTMTLAARTFSE